MSMYLIRTMEQLIQLNRSLYVLQVKKTEIVKKGDIEAFQQLQQNEQKHLAAIQKVDRERQTMVARLVPRLENPTVTDCLTSLTKTEQKKLVSLKEQLLTQLMEIKEQNDLNQQLIQQSLDFIHLNVNLLLPQQKQINYGPKSNEKQPTETRRIFQSEA